MESCSEGSDRLLTELDGSAAMDTLNESGALTFDFDGQEVVLQRMTC